MNLSIADLELSVFTNCPTDFTRSKVSPDPELGILVTWIEPTATDNAGQVTITSNYRPDQPFKDGIWRVQYSATDFSGNIGSCVFDITVYGKWWLQSQIGKKSFLRFHCKAKAFRFLQRQSPRIVVNFPVKP